MSMGVGAITSSLSSATATATATATAAGKLSNNHQGGRGSSSSVLRGGGGGGGFGLGPPLLKQQRQGFKGSLLLPYYPSHYLNHHPNTIVGRITHFAYNEAEEAAPSVFASCATSSSGSTASSYYSSIGSESGGGGGGSSSSLGLSLEIREIKEKCNKWQWRGHTINYLIVHSTEQVPNPNLNTHCRPPLLLVHGFGASIAHWRRNILTLSECYTVYAIDLLGFGASDKPAGFSYTMNLWAQLILDFLDEIVQRPTVLIGNSVGSLACVIAASESTRSLVRGLVLLNCAGGMNNKAIVDDWRIRLLLPLFWFIDALLKQRGIASFIFERVKQRDNLRNILLSVYGNKESVDEDLIEIIKEPANDEGALDAFVSIVTGPPGPNPVQLMQRNTLPVLVLWGDKDPFTPLDGPVGKYFSSLPAQLPNVSLFVLEGVGHCPHDDRPDLVHGKLLPWLEDLLPAL